MDNDNCLRYLFGLPSLLTMRPLDVMLLVHHFDESNKDIWLRLYANRVVSLASFVSRWSPYRRLYIYTVSFPESYIMSLDGSFRDYVFQHRVRLKSKDAMLARLRLSTYLLDYFTTYYTMVSKGQIL